eukprot:NODE_2560_length_1147_cov_103.389216_g2440_i0.p1 GENE.NODE_2560_length_1147_cov_103.389216_g2440_i0~~NODE_2560_length_1147_cov_103.389216_g2440_i0.p1  ORF type:complete len:311 (+),score=65.85 NODE_2560_length_1147_cov_103.389216_g2440_i0:83-1015(+)
MVSLRAAEKARLTRDDLEQLVSHPCFDELAPGCFVRVLLEGEGDGRKYRLGQINGVTTSPANYTFGNLVSTNKLLHLNFGAFTATYQMNTISNADLSQEEFDLWMEYASDPQSISEELLHKQVQLSAFKNSGSVLSLLQQDPSPSDRPATTVLSSSWDAAKEFIAGPQEFEQQTKRRLLEKEKRLNELEIKLVQERERFQQCMQKKEKELLASQQAMSSFRMHTEEFPTDLDKLSTAELTKLELKVEDYRLRIRSLISEKSKCAICMEAEACVIFYPCKHQTVCATCAKAVKRCPMCRAAIKDSFTPFEN